VQHHRRDEEGETPEDGDCPEELTVAELAMCKIVTTESFDSFDAVVAMAEHQREESKFEDGDSEENDVSRAVNISVMQVERPRLVMYSHGEERGGEREP
jgi:hypothetical protein